MKKKLISAALALCVAGQASAAIPPTAALSMLDPSWLANEYAKVYGTFGGGYPAFIMNPGMIHEPITATMITTSTGVINAIRELGGIQRSAAGDQGSHAVMQSELLAKQQESLRIDRQVEPAPSGCALQAMAQVATTVESGVASSAKQAMYRATTSVGNGSIRGGGNGSAPVPVDISAQKNKVIDDHEPYCTKETDPSCKATSNPVGRKGQPMVNADTNVQTLLGGGGKAGEDVLTFGPVEKQASEILIRNLTDAGEVPRPLTAQELNTPSGREYKALKIVYDAKMSAARAALVAIQASREPISGSSALMAQLRKAEVGAATPGTFSALLNSLGFTSDQDVSQAELNYIMAKSRGGNPDWFAGLTAASDSALFREQTMLLASIQQMLYEQSRTNELTTVIQAGQVAEQIRSEILPRLKEKEISFGTAGR